MQKRYMKKYTELAKEVYNSPFGEIKVYLKDKRVKKIELGKFKKGSIKKNSDNFISRAFDEYFKKRNDLLLKKIPLDMEHLKDKHKRVLIYLREKIKMGEVITYSELARKFKTSARAIGQFMKKNPFPIIIPCHRVVSKKGYGGYSPDLRWKIELLKLEKK